MGVSLSAMNLYPTIEPSSSSFELSVIAACNLNFVRLETYRQQAGPVF
ncbi:hypothetical protein [Microbulbifer sp. VVAC002]